VLTLATASFAVCGAEEVEKHLKKSPQVPYGSHL